MARNSAATARNRPLKHLSIRVPWHDSGWSGHVCAGPKENGSCLVLPRIRETRKGDEEASRAGQSVADLGSEAWPACVGERGTFMAPFSIERVVALPYAATTERHVHIRPTKLRQPAWSAPAVPFRWMNKEFAWALADLQGVDALPEREPTDPEWLAKRPWVQSGRGDVAAAAS